jgi:predicted RNA-binding protein YlqC (UPF0109 family)
VVDEDFNRLDADEDDDGPDPNLIAAPHARTVCEYVVRAMVEDADAVSVEVEEGNRGAIALNVHVAPSDMGRVIGKRGRIAQSIRAVVRAAAARDDTIVDVEFVE